MVLSIANILAVQDVASKSGSTSSSNGGDHSNDFHSHLYPELNAGNNNAVSNSAKGVLSNSDTVLLNQLLGLQPSGESVRTVTLENLQAGIAAMQEQVGTLDSATIDMLNKASVEIAGQQVSNGMSDQQIIEQLHSTITNSSENGIENILEKFDVSGNNKAVMGAEQIASQFLDTQKQPQIDITEIASKVIEVAKTDASKPEIPVTNINMIPIESLSKKNDNKTSHDSLSSSGLTITNSEIAKASQNNAIVNPSAIQQAQDKTLAVNLGASSNSVQSQIVSASVNGIDNMGSNAGSQQNTLATDISNTNMQLQNKALDSGISMSNAASEVLHINQNSLTPQINTISDSFIQFDNIANITNHSDAVSKNVTSTAKDVLAQIKFGITSTNAGEQNISIQLYPKELGKIDVMMQIGGDGKTNIMLFAEKTDTLNLLQKESGALREMLSDAMQTDSSNLNFAFQEKNMDQWSQNFADSVSDEESAEPGIASQEYAAAQEYVNMIVTQGLDISI